MCYLASKYLKFFEITFCYQFHFSLQPKFNRNYKRLKVIPCYYIPYYCTHQLACPITQLRSFCTEEERSVSPTPAGKACPVLYHIQNECKALFLSMAIGQRRFCSQGPLLQPGPKMAQRSVLLREIFFALLDIRLDGITARLPASWAHFPMCVNKWKGLNQSQCLIHRVANRKVVGGGLSKDTFIVCSRKGLNEMPSSTFKTPQS